MKVEVAVGYFKAADLAAGGKALSDDVIFAFHGEARHLSGAETLTGKSQAVTWLADWFSRFERDYRFEIDEALDLGDRVLVVTTHLGRGRTSGVPISQQTTQVLTIREDKIVRQDFFASRDEALGATSGRNSTRDEKRMPRDIDSMPEEAEEIVRRTVSAANQGDLESIYELASEDLEFHSTFAASEGRVFRGHQGIREYFATLEESFGGLRLEIEDVSDVGDNRVVLLLSVSGQGQGSAIPVRHRYGQVWTILDGTVRRIDSYLDPEEAMRAAGQAR